jgi:hypothetical protein
MEWKKFSLVEIIRDPGTRIYEASELSEEGHYYLYRYDAEEEQFYRATVPAGAAAIQFFALKTDGKVPLSGWYEVEKKAFIPFRPRLVPRRGSLSA